MDSSSRKFAVLAVAAFLLGSGFARAELGSTGAVSVGLAVSAGIQPDSRGCETAGTSRSVTRSSGCILWAGGFDAAILWRGHIGGSLGVWSVSGQAAKNPQGENGPGIPDRVSVPLLVDLRPLSFFVLASQQSYLSRLLYGVRLGIGPSLEFVRTSSDSSYAWGQRIGAPARALIGMHASLDGEVPLRATANGLALRLSTRFLYVPAVVLNDGVVQSVPIGTTEQSPSELAMSFQGYATHIQVYLGLVYYL